MPRPKQAISAVEASKTSTAPLQRTSKTREIIGALVQQSPSSPLSSVYEGGSSPLMMDPQSPESSSTFTPSSKVRPISVSRGSPSGKNTPTRKRKAAESGAIPSQISTPQGRAHTAAFTATATATATAAATTTTTAAPSQSTPRKYVVPPAFSRETTAESDSDDVPVASSSTTAVSSSLTAVSDRLHRNGAIRVDISSIIISDEEEDNDEDDLPSFEKMMKKMTEDGPYKGNKGDRKGKGKVRWTRTDETGIAKNDVCLVKRAGKEYCLAVLLDWQIAQSEREQQDGKERFLVLRRMPNMRNSKLVWIERRIGDEVVLKTEPAILDCQVEHYKIESTIRDSGARTRALTPDEELHPDPLPKPQMADLSLQEQLRHVRQALLRVINDDYTPALWRANALYNGDFRSLESGFDDSKAYLIDNKDLGDLTEVDNDLVVLPELRRWALRPDSIGLIVSDGRPSKRKKHDTQAHTGSRPALRSRPTGSERYEALSNAQREKFVQHVLRPEAMIQICIASVDLHDNSRDLTHDEQSLYQLARDHLGSLRNRVNWIHVEDQLSKARIRLELGRKLKDHMTEKEQMALHDLIKQQEELRRKETVDRQVASTELELTVQQKLNDTKMRMKAHQEGVMVFKEDRPSRARKPRI